MLCNASSIDAGTGLARTVVASRHVYTYLPFLVVQIFQTMLKQSMMLRHQQLVLSETVEKQASTAGLEGAVGACADPGAQSCTTMQQVCSLLDCLLPSLGTVMVESG